MTASSLRSYTAKDLAQMAREKGVSGWHSMRKEQLVKALIQQGGSRSRNGSPKQVRTNGKTSQTSAKALFKINQLQQKLATIKNLGCENGLKSVEKDRLVVMVRDPYWLHAYWELEQRSVDRAQAAMGQRWHSAQPVLRLIKVEADGSAHLERDIAIHGGVQNWYLDVQDPPSTYRLEIGYLSADEGFHCLARSNEVSTPPAGTSDAVDNNWADVAQQADRIYAMSGGYSPAGVSRELKDLLEERLQRPLGTPMKTKFGSGAAGREQGNLQFAVDAEVIVYGAADRDSHVTLKGEPVQLRDDGTFTVRVSLPERRQVIPVVASSADGAEQQTIILAIERNTKVMEKVERDVTG
ncbi:DUF4912 domain-containing protein [Adhaeretor mobilis]|uniref:Rho termination factor-like N-terminal domain-containing protein n=1 Tax=Adhaeretor mobilis TaxID=1930276 RepID=A0A517MXT9_9BACT|nr:DUF4912 domain-containing protein [Adhaeretor mobilis]QDS99694.1 hypothetical protein HG15A2_30210 [Adhaeretor mobilis]